MKLDHDRIAIVLRGPPGAGKTPIANAICSRISVPTKFVVLDEGWCAGEKRFDPTTRYDDLRSSADVLIVELGWAEPSPPLFAGATLNPSEWLRVLEEERRRVFMFLLWTPLGHTLARKTGRMDLLYAALAHERYMPGNVCSATAFAVRLGHRGNEVLHDTSMKSVDDVAEEVLRAAGIIERTGQR